jgi:DNA repair protein RecN (Recombination protein N)
MLQSLRVRNLALLAEAELEFAPGFNVITGETGEGKSLVLSAIALALGGRARADWVRRGSEGAEIDLALELCPSQAQAAAKRCTLVDGGERELVLGRTLRADGGSKASVNGRLSTASMLAELAAQLVGFHAQDEQRLFRDAAEQCALVDAFAGTSDAVQAWCEERGAARAILQELEDLRASLAARAERMEFLEERLSVLRRIQPREGEERELAAELRLHVAGREFLTALCELEAALSSGDGALADAASRARRRLAPLATGHAALTTLMERVESLEIEARDIGAEARALAETLGGDPERQQVVERRLEEIRDAARRCRCSADQLPGLVQQWGQEVANLEGGDAKVAELERDIAAARIRLRREAGRILEVRKGAAARLKHNVEEVLASLRMEKARIAVELEPAHLPPAYDALEDAARGPGGVRFLLAANQGEDLLPLERVASGGELSRILLAFTSALAKAFTTPVLVLDEVDAGVSGRTAAALGRHLADLAQQRQVISVTHLPQVAAYAQRHWKVSKCTDGGRTWTTVRELRGEERVQELADMLGGDVATSAAKAQARALLAEANV